LVHEVGVVKREWTDSFWLNQAGEGLPEETVSGYDELSETGMIPWVAAGCGDVNDDTIVGDLDDLASLRQFLADPDGSPLSPGGLSKCSVFGTSADCDIADAVVLRRFLTNPVLMPGITPVCEAAVGAP
jgi:hypothetical protein